jgi:hypothetical protein
LEVEQVQQERPGDVLIRQYEKNQIIGMALIFSGWAFLETGVGGTYTGADASAFFRQIKPDLQRALNQVSNHQTELSFSSEFSKWRTERRKEEREQAQQGDPKPPHHVELKGPGMFIRSFLESSFDKEMFNNFWLGKGDVNLTAAQFKNIALEAKRLGIDFSKGKWVTRNNQYVLETVVSFYGSKEYAASLGRATMYFDYQGNAVGLVDYFDFDAKSWFERPLSAEFKTRMVDANAEAWGAKPFKISYP